MLLATLLLGSLSWLQAFGQGYHVAAYVPQYPPQPPFPLGGNAPYPQPGGYPQGPQVQIYPGPFEPDIPRAPAQYVWGGPGPSYQKPPGPSWYPQQQQPPPGYNQLQYIPPRPPPTRPPAPPQLPPGTPKPSEIMADCVNLLAVKVLFDHASARGNFVFSPYGATSVLCVLWEGSTGATSRQLQQALILPSEPDTVRVGMRDLHRHLKSYFGHNGYLQGVELSRDKETSLRVDFIPVLRIYGYHMEEKKPEEDATTTMAPDSAMQGSNSEGASTQSPEVDLEEVTVLPEEHHNTEVTTMSASTESSVDPMQSTHSPESMNSTTQSTSESSKPESTTTESMSSSKPSESMSSTTESMSNKPESMSSTSESTLASESSKPESMISTTESMSDKPESMSSTTDSMLASKPESMSSTSESTLASESSKPESMTSTTESMSDKPESMALVSSTSIPEPTSTEVSDLTTLTTMHSEVTTMHSDMSTGAASEALTVTSMPDDETQTQGSTTLQSDEATPLEPAEENEDEEGARRKRESNDKNVLFPDIALTSGRENMTEQTEDVDNDPLATRRSFRLFSGTFTRPVPVMERRGELLPFASLPGLRSIAAMLPLDDPRYGLLVLLPTDGRGPALKQLAAELTQVPLRKVLAALRISRLHVTLPKFAARGPVVLTSSLQQLGIWDVFDPRLARFDRMSTDPGLFVRELEQTVRIDFGTARSINTRVITARSVPEVVDLMRPFLYFVVDRETQTALLAGKVEDPSTPRIF